MSFAIGIIGLPNVGKSTIFKALTKKQVPAENFPFCTINPNIGVVAVPDKRLKNLSDISKSEKIIPTTIEFVDIAGLVKGAHKGEGLGNKFLAHIREVDAIAHVVRDFESAKITHVENRINPKEDQEIINLELIMADLSTIEKKISEYSQKAKNKDKQAALALLSCEKIKSALDKGKPARSVELTKEEQESIKELCLITSKPELKIMNVHEKDATKIAENKNEIVISAKIESELAEMELEDAKIMLKELGLKNSGLDKLITASYQLLNLITFFTSGPKETRAWTIEKGSSAPEAAGKIHTDFEKGFIRAEVIGCEDFINFNGESGAKENGKMRLEGKDYIIEDGDVCHFRFSV